MINKIYPENVEHPHSPGTDPADIAANEANEWLRPRELPSLPPIDSVSQWKFILRGENGREDPVHLSENAILHW